MLRSFDKKINAFKTRMARIESSNSNHNVFPMNTRVVLNARTKPISGGQGTVHRARMRATQQPVIRKVFKRPYEYRHEFIAHVEAYARLYGKRRVANPIIAAPIFLGDHRSMAQTLLPNSCDLVEHYKKNDGRPTPRIGVMLRDALRRLHRRGILHGDISADNVLVYRPSDDSRSERVALIDFGLCEVQYEHALSEDDLRNAARRLPLFSGDKTPLIHPRSDYAWMYMTNTQFSKYYAAYAGERETINMVLAARKYIEWDPFGR